MLSPQEPKVTSVDKKNSLKHWSATKFTIPTFQVCTQVLEVLDRVEITNVSVSAGHPSSSSIYPACFAPYVITTACSDGTVRFWKCQTADSSGTSENQAVKYEWHEWEMMIRTEDTSSIKVPGLYLCKLYITLIVIINWDIKIFLAPTQN